MNHFQARGHAIDRDQFIFALKDEEVLQMARDQCKYRYLSDKHKFTAYAPGEKFMSCGFKVMKEAEWKKLNAPAAPEAQETPENKENETPEENENTEKMVE